MTHQFDTFQSPFSWRYGSKQMRSIWSETYKRQLWRRMWVALADAQTHAGLVTPEQFAELRAHMNDIDIDAAHQVEAEIHHDLMAEVHVFASQCPHAGGIIHLGATSMDIEDNAEALRLREALGLIQERLAQVLQSFAAQIEKHAHLSCMAYTHIQPAEPTTLGYRLAQYAQDLLIDYSEISQAHANVRGKGFKGAVGTSASYQELLIDTGFSAQELEAHIMAAIELEPFPVATQTYPRKQDWLILNSLAGLASSVYKFALDLRLLQTPSLGEWSESFAKKQVGSSAMPFKRNPIQAEQLCSLARMIATLPRVAWDNAAYSMLERTLDDSANRRSVLPEAFLAADQLLLTMLKLIQNLQIDEAAIARNLSIYGTFSATERVMMAAVRNGADRQHLHEVLRQQSMLAWQAIAQGQANPLIEALCQDTYILTYLTPAQIQTLMEARHYVGDAPQRALELAKHIRTTLSV